MRFSEWLKELIQMLCGTKPHMIIIVKRNPGLRHQECDGGVVAFKTDRTTRRNTVSCSRCGAMAEFDLIYERLFSYILDDGKQREIPIRRYCGETVKKGRIAITTH